MRRSPADSTNRSLAAFGKLQHILLAFFPLAARCAAVIVSKDLLPPIRPPLAPCSLKNWKTSNGSFFIVRHILTPLWWQASVLVVTRSQYGFYLQTDADRSRACRFVRILPDRGVAAEDDRAIFPGGALAVHITHQPIYRALGIENVKHRRGAKDTTTLVLMRRLLSLDYLIGRPTLGWVISRMMWNRSKTIFSSPAGRPSRVAPMYASHMSIATACSARRWASVNWA